MLVRVFAAPVGMRHAGRASGAIEMDRDRPSDADANQSFSHLT